MAGRSGSYTYDPTTGKWKYSAGTTSATPVKSTTNTTKKSTTSAGNKKSSSSGTENLVESPSGSKKKSDSKVAKKYNTIEFNTLSGTLCFIANKKTIKLQAGDTVKLKGFGKYLSGKYYVKDVTRQIGSNGYSHEATVIKVDVGDSLKSTTKSKDTSAKTKKEKSASTKSKNVLKS